MAASKTLTFDIFGRDKTASKTIKGIGKTADDMGAKLSKVGAGIGIGLAAAGAAAVAFGVSSVKAFAEAEKSQAKLADAFDRFPELSDTSMKALGELNSELAKKTRFDDDATAAAQAQLAQYKLTGKQIVKLTPLVQDYAAKTGKDLPDAATALGKALLGQGRALKDIGIDFEDTGSLAGNFDSIVGSLSEKVGGFAEKDGATASGRLEILNNRFGEVQEKIGEALIPALGEAADAMDTTFMPAIEGAAEWLATDGIPQVVKFAEAFKGVQDASYQFGYTMADNLKPAYDALYQFGVDIEPIISGFSNFWQDVGYNLAGDFNNAVAAEKAKEPMPVLPTPKSSAVPNGRIPGLATGGTALAAGMALIGEKGPELIHMPKGASVIPLDRATGGGGSATINVYPTPGMSEYTVGRIAGAAANKKLRRNA